VDAGLQMEQYEKENLRQPEAEEDLYTAERYQQFARHLRPRDGVILDVGCSTGRGGEQIGRLVPQAKIWGLDVVQSRLDALPDVYSLRLRGLSTDIPLEDGSVDAVLAGEFLEHLLPRDVDPTLCEFQRILRVGGQILLTTPNPRYVRLRLTNRSVFGPGHLTQHFPEVLRLRLMMHGFSHVRVRGSGRMSRYLTEHLPVLPLYGSYLMLADKR
jgi:ubiquinone/menaquinone biosynthesis C-methylase UbiE